MASMRSRFTGSRTLSARTTVGRSTRWKQAGKKRLLEVPKEIYQLWKDYLQPRGYKIAYQIIDFPGGVPGDIGITLSWG